MRSRLLLLTLLALLPSLAVAGLTQWRVRYLAREDALRDYRQLAQLAAEQLVAELEMTDALLATIGHAPSVIDGACDRFLEGVPFDQARYTNLIVFAPEGSVVCSARPLPAGGTDGERLDVANRAGFQRALLTGRPSLGDTFTPTDGVARLALQRPVSDATGRVQRVVVAGLRADWLGQQLARRAVAEGVTLAIVDRQGAVIAKHSPDPVAVVTPDWPDSRWLEQSMTGALDAPGAGGQARLWMTRPVVTSFAMPLFVTVGLDSDLMSAPASRLFWWQAGLLLIVGALTAIVGLVVGELVALRPVRRLGAVLGKLAGGDLTARAQVKSGAPGISELAGAVDAMADALTERERALSASERRYRRLFEGHAHPLFIYDPDTLRLLSCNQAATARYGYSRESLQALTLLDLHVEEDRSAVQALYHGQLRHSTRAWEHRTSAGERFQAETSVSPVPWDEGEACLLLVEDVTDRVRLEAEVRQGQKMRALGRLAGGIAHDFNNLLTSILGYSHIVADSLRHNDPRRADMTEVITAASRAAALTRQLLAFSRQRILAPHVLSLGAHVRGIAPELERTLGPAIQMSIATNESGHVMADAGQLTEVLTNLALNARDAMPDGGSLRIETADRVVEPGREGAQLTAVPAGSYVALLVRDTGRGMDAATLERAVEPFFTTKPLGQGTGLGLSTVHGIVEQCGGYLRAESAPGRGTTWTILLLRVQAQPALEPAPDTPASPQRPTILVVEDQESVRSFVTRLLEQAGYVVLSAPAPGGALELAARHQGAIDLVLTDVTMPEMSGDEAARRIREIHPEALVLYMSGFADRRHAPASGSPLLPKPFSADALYQSVRNVLASRPAA